MTARNIQISIDEELLAQVDSEEETKRIGRSEFLRNALHAYLALQRAREIDRAYESGYGGRARHVDDEFAPLMKAQR